MFAHEVAHGAVIPESQTLLVRLICYPTCDLLVCTLPNWLDRHHKEHHSFPTSNVDGQRLTGDNSAEENYNIVMLLFKYQWEDIKLWRSNPLHIIAFVARWYFLAGRGWFAFLCTMVSAIVSVSYFGLLTHSNPLAVASKGYRQKQLQNTYDIMPGNWFAEFIFAGLNSHATHHVYPQLPRGLHGRAAEKLRKLEPAHYRSVDTLSALWTAFKTREAPPPQPECCSPADYYKPEFELNQHVGRATATARG
eukprot:TRINITY_DN68038_c4_g1_i1.p1 TRINITY_DN68038_c4_g1~~TRINITY_DN68038_c4_g1_i1.p1  ORF type:complete len:250 (+),score=15.71 TRINITY_DN68038_c4_g1_i1:232-981(+)